LPESFEIDAVSPFTASEERQILDQLYELRRARSEIGELRDYIRRDAAIDERERATAGRALELEREATRLAGTERDIMRERAQLYESLYRAISAGPSFGCRVARVITIGLYRCR
jgi:hypothetical protein